MRGVVPSIPTSSLIPDIRVCATIKKIPNGSLVIGRPE